MGELGRSKFDRLECQANKAYLDWGQEYADELVDKAFDQAFDPVIKGGPKAPTPQETLANEGYDCTASEALPAPPTPEDLDKKYERPADNPKQLEMQCSPQSNASPAFREKYC